MESLEKIKKYKVSKLSVISILPTKWMVRSISYNTTQNAVINNYLSIIHAHTKFINWDYFVNSKENSKSFYLHSIIEVFFKSKTVSQTWLVRIIPQSSAVVMSSFLYTYETNKTMKQFLPKLALK